MKAYLVCMHLPASIKRKELELELELELDDA